MKNTEEGVSRFYNTVGWETEDGITEDAKRWEDLREYAQEYVKRCRLRILDHIPEKGEFFLDMGSGPIQYIEYLEYSRNFKKRYCVDLCSEALESAKKKIGDHGVFLHGSFFDIPLEENFFDCAISLHTIYHIDKDRQEEAVRKLIRVTKPGKPVIIVYANLNTIVSSLGSSLPYRVLKGIISLHDKKEKQIKDGKKKGIYVYVHPLEWWTRFEDIAHIKIFPWRSFVSEVQKKLIPNNRIGNKMFDLLFMLEDRFHAVNILRNINLNGIKRGFQHLDFESMLQGP